MFNEKLQFIPLNQLSHEQHVSLLTIRNLQSIRHMMNDTKEISMQRHLAWVKESAIGSKQCYYAILWDEDIVGGINFVDMDIRNGSCSWGVFFEPSTSPALTSFVTYLFLNYLFESKNMQVIWAQVRRQNPQALRFNESFGFTCKRQDEQFSQLKLTKDGWQKRSKSRLFQTLLLKFANTSYQFTQECP